MYLLVFYSMYITFTPSLSWTIVCQGPSIPDFFILKVGQNMPLKEGKGIHLAFLLCTYTKLDPLILTKWKICFIWNNHLLSLTDSLPLELFCLGSVTPVTLWHPIMFTVPTLGSCVPLCNRMKTAYLRKAKICVGQHTKCPSSFSVCVSIRDSVFLDIVEISS